MRYCFHTPSHTELYSFYCQMDALAYGSGVALLVWERERNPATWLPTDKFFDWLCPVLWLLWMLLSIVTDGDLSSGVLCVLAYFLMDVSLALLVYGLIRKSGGDQIWVRAMRVKWLRSVGTVSYSLYLFHVFMLFTAQLLVGHFIAERHVRTVLSDLLGLLFSFCTAYGLWYGLESRVLRLKDRVVPRSSPERVAARVKVLTTQLQAPQPVAEEE